MELIRELNYNCNSDIFNILFSMKKAQLNREDCRKVNYWLSKIMKNNKTVSDLKLRNEFLQSLKENIQSGKLKPPFNQELPIKGTLKALVHQLPGFDENLTQDDEILAMLRFLPAKHGGFLLPKPLPRIGAYIYIAASSHADCLKKKSFLAVIFMGHDTNVDAYILNLEPRNFLKMTAEDPCRLVNYLPLFGKYYSQPFSFIFKIFS